MRRTGKGKSRVTTVLFVISKRSEGICSIPLFCLFSSPHCQLKTPSSRPKQRFIVFLVSCDEWVCALRESLSSNLPRPKLPNLTNLDREKLPSKSARQLPDFPSPNQSQGLKSIYFEYFAHFWQGRGEGTAIIS